MTAEEKLAHQRELNRIRSARFRARNPRKSSKGLLAVIEAQRTLIAAQRATIEAMEGALSLRNELASSPVRRVG